MSFKDDVQKELSEFKAWAAEMNMQARLAKSNLQAEARTAWMEAEQNIAKLEAKLDKLGDTVDHNVQGTVDQLKASYKKLRATIKD
jgi:hypothetical protein